MKVIGILGGSSDQATADYYRAINKEVNRRLGGWNTGEIVIYSVNFADIEHFVRNELWDEAAIYLSGKARLIERGGAGLFLCVSNTLHKLADAYTAAVSIPFVHIADPTGRAIRSQGLKRVAILGTKPVMSTDYMKARYRDRFGIDVIAPEPYQQDEIDRIIFDELCRGTTTVPSKRCYLEAIDNCVERGAQGIILGCTEIPLLISPADRPGLPIFNTLELHAAAAVDLALA